MKTKNNRVYLASGWFNENQVRRLKEAEKTLKEMGFDVFSPWEHQHTEYEMFSVPWRKVTFNSDIKHVEWCDFIFTIYDEEDSGAMWESGYAHAFKKPLIVFHEKEEAVNLMVSDSLTAYMKTWEEVKAYDFDNFPYKGYAGEVI